MIALIRVGQRVVVALRVRDDRDGVVFRIALEYLVVRVPVRAARIVGDEPRKPEQGHDHAENGNGAPRPRGGQAGEAGMRASVEGDSRETAIARDDDHRRECRGGDAQKHRGEGVERTPALPCDIGDAENPAHADDDGDRRERDPVARGVAEAGEGDVSCDAFLMFTTVHAGNPFPYIADGSQAMRRRSGIAQENEPTGNHVNENAPRRGAFEFMVVGGGLEPSARGFSVRCSTN